MSSTQRKQRKQKGIAALSPQYFSALTNNQQSVYDAISDNDNLLLHGIAGSGKSFSVLHQYIHKLVNHDKLQIVIIRSVVPSRDMGFLPGTAEEKSYVYELPYINIVNKIFSENSAYQTLKNFGYIHFETTSFLRGITFDNACIFVDEIENMTFSELNTIMTRIGQNCQIAFAGDYHQSDLKRDKDDVLHFIEIVKSMNNMKLFEFSIDDIVRSSLVKEYLVKKQEYYKKCNIPMK